MMSLHYLQKKLKKSDLYSNAEVWIDEFTTFTPQQMMIIKELAKSVK